MSELITRSFEVRAENTADREVSGIAVPYDTVAHNEMFAYGAAIPVENTKLFWQHGEPIGRITESLQTPDGLFVRAKFTEGVRQADEAYALVKDGVINQFSVGFNLTDSHMNEDGVNVVTAADVREISLVSFPFYESANVTEVRNEPLESVEETETMTETPVVADLEEVRAEIENIRREVAVSLEARTEEPVMDTRTAGEVLHAIVTNPEEARAYTGATTADSVLRNAWVGDLTRIVEQAAPLLALFSRGALPAEGNYIEYAALNANTITVGKQAAEGDALALGKIDIDSKTAAVSTYGGGTTLSRQVIERSSIAYLDHSLRALAVAAGVQVNTAVRADYEALHAAQVTALNKITFGKTTWAAGTYQDWIAAAIDAQIKFQALGLSMDALVVPPAVFKNLLNVSAADGRPVFLVSGAGSNNVGSLSVTGLSGDLASIPVIVDQGLGADKVAFVNRNAIRCYTSPTTQLTIEAALDLTKTFGQYFYMAIADEIPGAVVPVVRA